MFENKELLKIPGPKRDKTNEQLRVLRNEELRDFYRPPGVTELRCPEDYNRLVMWLRMGGGGDCRLQAREF